jgi:hypothetical protein
MLVTDSHSLTVGGITLEDLSSVGNCSPHRRFRALADWLAGWHQDVRLMSYDL